jgi:hypothetical protein
MTKESNGIGHGREAQDGLASGGNILSLIQDA